MKQGIRLGAAVVALLLGVAACGGDNSDAADDQPSDDVASTSAPSDAADSSDSADAGSSGGDGGDDILADFLAGSGLTTDIVTDEQHECMNAELRPLYPDGLPDPLADEDIDAVDAAAETCDVSLL